MVALTPTLSTAAPLKAQPAPAVTCTACLLVDDTGRELFARRASLTLPNASTTKMTTALVVRRHAALDDNVLVSATAAATGGGGLDLQAGDVFTVEALLHALLLDSSNDAAVALAEHVAGSERRFVAEMNQVALDLGATGTHYVTAHGLDVAGHGSTARDLATIGDRLLDDPALARIVARERATIAGPRGRVTFDNRNLLLDSYPGATGVKTGFTADAGNVLVASAERSGRRLIAVVMHSVDAAADAAALLDAGWLRLERTVVLRTGTQVGALVFDGGSTQVVTATPVRSSVRAGDVDFEFLPSPKIRAPVARGMVVGSVRVTSPEGSVATVEAVALSAVQPDETGWAEDLFTSVLRTIGQLVGSP